MADVFSSGKRSQIMARVHSKNTSPELTVRKELHRLGFRYSLNSSHLPGKPDIVFSKQRKLIFVHGCFWHQHKGCKASERPTSNVEYWSQKLEKNTIRDKKNISLLRKSGWDVLVLWECQIKKAGFLTRKLNSFMHKPFIIKTYRAATEDAKGSSKEKRSNNTAAEKKVRMGAERHERKDRRPPPKKT